MYRQAVSLSSYLKAMEWPEDHFVLSLPGQVDPPTNVLDHIFVLKESVSVSAGDEGSGPAASLSLTVSVVIGCGGPLEVGMPGLEGVSFVFGSAAGAAPNSTAAGHAAQRAEVGQSLLQDGGDEDEDYIEDTLDGWTTISVLFHVQIVDGNTSWHVSFPDIMAAISFDTELLHDPDGGPCSISVHGSVEVDDTYGVRITGFDKISLTECEIGDTGITISANNVLLDLDRSASPPEISEAGFDDSFLGIYFGEAVVKLPPDWPALPDTVTIKSAAFGSGGVSMELTAGEKAGVKLFGANGFDFDLKEVYVKLVQNTLVAAAIKGQLKVPFFGSSLDVTIGADATGTLTASVTGDIPLTIPGVAEFKVAALGFAVGPGGASVALGGELTPTLPGMDWPTFGVQELRVYLDGRVELAGGWVDLPEQKPLDFHGFGAEITRFGFGKEDDGRNWIGFSGSLQLVKDLGIGAEFEGMRILWDPEAPNAEALAASASIELSGVGVDLTIPGVLAFSGDIGFIDDGDAKGFRGGVLLTIYPTLMTINAEVLFAVTDDGTTVLYLYLGADFPAGIPLGNTGVALFGLAGLYGQNVAPDRLPTEHWYENWYKGARLAPNLGKEQGVTSSQKWAISRGSMAFGAGVTLGTVVDNGYSVNGKMLLVLLLPGPVILIHGRANLLTDRANLSNPASEPLFDALAILDAGAGELLVNVAAHYRKDEQNAQVIDIRAGTEFYADFKRADNWHLYLGQAEPVDMRIRALVLKMLEANAYLMLTARDLRMGFWAGFDRSWDFGVLQAGLSAWVAVDAELSWKPVHLKGRMQLHGSFDLEAFGVGMSVSANARIDASTPTPKHIVAELALAMDLPWFLPDVEANARLNWGDDSASPPIPLVVGAVAVEHLRVSEKWPLRLYPKLGQGGFRDAGANLTFNEAAIFAKTKYEDLLDPPEGIPVVPLDSCIVVSFARPVHSDKFNHSGNGLTERVGGVTFEYWLDDVTLFEKDSADSAWRDAESAMDGTWQLVNGGDDSLPNAKLVLGAKTTTDWSREQSGPLHWTWIRNQISDLYCPRPEQWAQHCVYWEGVAPGTAYGEEFHHDGLTMRLERADAAGPPPESRVVYRPSAVHGHRVALGWFLEAPSALLVAGSDRSRRDNGAGWMDTPTSAPQLASRQLSRRAMLFPQSSASDSANVRFHIRGFPDQTRWIKLFSEHSAMRRVPLDITVYYSNKTEQKIPSLTWAAELTIDVDEARGQIDAVVVETALKPPQYDGTVMRDPGELVYLYRICYEYLLDGETGVDAAATKDIDNVLSSWTGTSTIFKPNTFYKLVIETRVDQSGKATESYDYKETVFFRTGDPPGVFDLPDSDSTTPAEPAPPPTARPHYPDQGPLVDLSPYVERTVPDTQQRAVYRAYDVKALFSASYVEAMYFHADMPLQIGIFDAAGSKVASIDNVWGVNPVRKLTRTETEYLYTVDTLACDRLETPIGIAAFEQLLATTTGSMLAPDMLHEARLEAVGQDKIYTAYRWSFTTSRFAHFRHHVGSFGDRLWDEHAIRGYPTRPLFDSKTWSDLESLVAATPASGSSGLFDQFAFALGFGTEPKSEAPARWLRPRPKRLEITLLRDAARRFGLLIETVEPIARGRGALGGASEDRVSWSTTELDETVASRRIRVLGANIGEKPGGGRITLEEEYVDLLVLEDIEVMSGWILKTDGAPEPVFTFPLGSSYMQGTVLRIFTAAANRVDEKLVDASVVPLYAGRSEAIVNSAAGVVVRFILTRPEPARSDDPPVHELERSVVIDWSESLALRLIWNADRTAAFAVFPTPGASKTLESIRTGSYRLKCLFRRTLEVGHPIWSQHEVESDETVDLYFEIVAGPGERPPTPTPAPTRTPLRPPGRTPTPRPPGDARIYLPTAGKP